MRLCFCKLAEYEFTVFIYYVKSGFPAIAKSRKLSVVRYMACFFYAVFSGFFGKTGWEGRTI